MSEPRRINLSDLPWTSFTTDDRTSVEIRDPARKLGSTLAGLRVYRLAPGKRSTRLHRHHYQEEFFLILSGEGTLRHGTEDVPVAPGDFIFYPAGDPVPHTFLNTGKIPLEYIATGNRVSYEVCEYPDERTVYVEALDKTLRDEEIAGASDEKAAWYRAGR
jgi:uncharacterized cupin superfamily protein